MIKREHVSYCRHPLVYLVEAADDICYQIMDIEDAHKLKILGTREVIDLLLGFFNDDKQQHIRHVMNMLDDKNEKIAYLRSCAIGVLVAECASAFVDNEESIMFGQFEGSLIDSIGERVYEGY